MQPPFPPLTATWHNVSYAAISPSRRELSAAGKTVVITGASAARIVLLGRDTAKLEESQRALSCTTAVQGFGARAVASREGYLLVVGNCHTMGVAGGYTQGGGPGVGVGGCACEAGRGLCGFVVGVEWRQGHQSVPTPILDQTTKSLSLVPSTTQTNP
ncbi:hypothetical protein BJX99DRAFT_256554 [Aspergillus californicus]